MVVTLIYSGLRIVGLQVGASNAKRFFPANSTAIELHLDHLTILCPITARFWEDRAILNDPRLCGWLETKFHNKKSPQTVSHVEMVPAGPGAFRIASFTAPVTTQTSAALAKSATA